MQHTSPARRAVTLSLSPEALARLDRRTAAASAAARVPVPRALVAAGLLHEALGLAPDGSLLAGESLVAGAADEGRSAPPGEDLEPVPVVAGAPAPLSPTVLQEAAPPLPSEPPAEHQAEPPPSPRAARRAPSRGKGRRSRAKGKGRAKGPGISPAPSPNAGGRESAAAVIATFGTLARVKDPDARRRAVAGYLRELQERCGLGADGARAALQEKGNKRKLRLALADFEA